MAYNGIRFGQGINVFPVQPPKDVGGLTTDTLDVDIRDANWVTFLVNLGNLTSDATDTITLTVEATTDGATTGDAVAFWYRLSSASATNTWGDVTAGTSDGVAIVGAAAGDNMSVLLDVDPAVVRNSVTGAVGVYVNSVTVGPIALMSTTAFVEHKYPGNTMSSTY